MNFPFPIQSFPVADPEYFGGFYDFLTDSELTDFVATTTGTGAVTVADTNNGGVLSIDTPADTDTANVQLDAEVIKLDKGQRVIMTARHYFEEDTNSAILPLGAFITDTTLIAGVTDGFGFMKDDTNKELDFVVKKDSSADSWTNVYTVNESEWVRFGIMIEMDKQTSGKGKLWAYVNGIPVIRAEEFTNGPDNELLTPSMALTAGADNVSTLVDYLGYAALRSPNA